MSQLCTSSASAVSKKVFFLQWYRSQWASIYRLQCFLP